MKADAPRSLKHFWLPVALVLAVHAVLGISAAGRLTATHDEYWHLPIGLLNLRTGRFNYDNLNPPLCRMAAVSPVAAHVRRPGWSRALDPGLNGFGDAFIAANLKHYDTWYLLGRTMIVAISVLGGLVTAIWARGLFGDKVGILAALLWAFEPNLIAHGSLVTTDMGAAAFFVFTLFAVWKFAERPNWKMALVFGGVLGLAQLAKFTSLVLYPIAIVEFVLFTAAHREKSGESDTGPAKAPASPRSMGRLCGLWILALATSLIVLNAGYLFRGSFSSLKSYDLQSSTLRGAAQGLSSIGGLPVPLPRDYVEGLDHQRQVMEQKHPVFLDGQWSEDGIPHYYLWGLLYKLPHPLQILLLATLFWLVMPGTFSRRPLTQVAILLPALAMVALAESFANAARRPLRAAGVSLLDFVLCARRRDGSITKPTPGEPSPRRSWPVRCCFRCDTTRTIWRTSTSWLAGRWADANTCSIQTSIGARIWADCRLTSTSIRSKTSASPILGRCRRPRSALLTRFRRRAAPSRDATRSA